MVDHLAAKAAVLADPVTLLIYAEIVTSTSGARQVDSFGHPPTSGIAYLTSHGLRRTTRLAADEVADAVGRLAAAGLVELRGDPAAPTANFRVVDSAWGPAPALPSPTRAGGLTEAP